MAILGWLSSFHAVGSNHAVRANSNPRYHIWGSRCELPACLCAHTGTTGIHLAACTRFD